MAPIRPGLRALEWLAGSSTGLGQVLIAQFLRVELMVPLVAVIIIKSGCCGI